VWGTGRDALAMEDIFQFEGFRLDQIITALSRIRWLFVIARNSSFTYKGQAVDVKRVGRELGVRYVLEGSVRKAGQRMRIAAQLVDATTGASTARSKTCLTFRTR
jgi:TolB-like protein